MMLTAEIWDARLPGGRMTIVATHLEDKPKPEGRRLRQRRAAPLRHALRAHAEESERRPAGAHFRPLAYNG